MKDLLLIPLLAPVVAQAAPVGSEWERLGITGLSVVITVFIWRYFNAKQDEAAKASMAERDRLLKENNEKSQQIINLLKQQVEDSRRLASGQDRLHTITENTERNPVPVVTQPPK